MAATASHARAIADTLAGSPPPLVVMAPGRTADAERSDLVAWLEAQADDAEADAIKYAARHLYGRAEAFQQRATSYRAAIVALMRGDHEGMRHGA